MRPRINSLDLMQFLRSRTFRIVGGLVCSIFILIWLTSGDSSILERRPGYGLKAGTDGWFSLGGRRTRIISGSIHYFRVVPEYWMDRLIKLRRLGANAVETYVPWNLHEEVRGRFKFGGILDIRRFIKTAEEVGLFVILRPGPFICAEWEFGGLPSWLLADPDMRVRESYGPYLNAVQNYMEHLLPMVADLQYTDGGPIIAFQVENEYGSYSDDRAYMAFLVQLFKANGVHEMLFTSDGAAGKKGSTPNVMQMVNFHGLPSAHAMLPYLAEVQPGQPKMVAEYWTGWFDHWGESHQSFPLTDFEETLGFVLEKYGNVNLYVFHGGTNFGFMNGANQFVETLRKSDYAPTVTSYDYLAPLSESGEVTPKYYKLQDMLKPYINHQQVLYLGGMPEQTVEAARTTIPHRYGIVTIQYYMPLKDIVLRMDGISKNAILPMELLPINGDGGQGYGFILYSTTVARSGKLVLNGRVRDRAVILVDDREIATVNSTVIDFAIDIQEPGRLDILVENMGRVNFARFHQPFLNNQRKGLIKPVTFDGTEINDWTLYPLEFKEDAVWEMTLSQHLLTYTKDRGALSHVGVYVGELVIYGMPRDTFVDMQGWTKGVVFINGRNLGRYWSLGPQRTLYLPGPLLKTGVNKITIFELHRASSTVLLVDVPDHGR